MKRNFIFLCILAALLLVGCSKTERISSEDKQQAVNNDVQKGEHASTANVSEIENTGISLLPKSDKNPNATDAFFHFISSGIPTEKHELRNGDIATIKWRIDDEKIEKYFSLNYSYSDIEVKINGLPYYPETINSINESIFDEMDNYCSAYLQKESK